VASELVAQLPRDARRVIVRGCSGSGKTTLARRIAEALGVPHVELDGIFHQPGWQMLDDAAANQRVSEFVDDGGWVVCGNYRVVADQLLDRADTVVLYDLPRAVVMSRVLRRTIGRVGRRKELWNGNREQLGNVLSFDPERSIVAWAWTTHARKHVEINEFLQHPPREHLRLVHLASTEDERRLYAGLPRPSTVAVSAIDTHEPG
jgi:adenylate kinase family enzyme